jgi:uncharacterized membrane protein YidH (DUF202 family)
MDDEVGGTRGGSVGDMRTLHYWSRVSFYFLVGGGVAWVALGVLRLHRGLSWYQLDELTGSTRAVSDLSWGIACMALAVLSFFIAGRLQLDVVSVFRQMRFQVPREKLAVYGLLGFPLGLVVSGVLLVLVNFKLSHPEFLPSHAEAYPEVFYVAKPPPSRGEVGGGEAGGGEAGGGEAGGGEVVAPEPATPSTALLVEGGPPPTLVHAPPPGPVPGAPVPAIYEEVAVETAQAPAAQWPVPGEAQPVAAIYEEVPAGAAYATAAPPAPEPDAVVAIIEDAPPQPAGFEEVAPAATVQELPEETTAPKDIKTAHEELMRKLLGKG